MPANPANPALMNDDELARARNRDAIALRVANNTTATTQPTDLVHIPHMNEEKAMREARFLDKRGDQALYDENLDADAEADKFDRAGDEYEDMLDHRKGNNHSKPMPSHQGKPRSVRM